jgi:hypothetical protein
MVETTYMTKNELINTINEIKNNYHDDGLLIWFYRDVNSLNDSIKTSVSEKLYEDFKIELRCVYYESLYGDGEYTDHVVNDCIKVLDSIIDTLTH